MAHQIAPNKSLEFMLAGNATFTLVAPKTKERRTFKVQEDEKTPGKFFVKFLSGSDNESDEDAVSIDEASIAENEVSTDEDVK